MTNKKTKYQEMTKSVSEQALLDKTPPDKMEANFGKAGETIHNNARMIDATGSAYRARFSDIQMKAMEIVQINLNSSFSYMRKFLAIREPANFFKLQQSFLHEQFETFSRQATELNELSVLLAKETTQPIQERAAKNFSTFSKNLAG